VFSGLITKVSAVVVLLLLLAACESGPPKRPAIGEAYVGPATLKIRADIPLEAPTVATVKHGDRLEIIGRRRRFLLVRTPGGVEGWTHERQLLSSSDMAALRGLAERAAKMPPQGQATTFGALNIHTMPSRQAPSFFQVQPKQKVDVLASVIVPRTDLERAPLIPPKPKKEKAAFKKPKKEPKYPPLVVPKPPPPPANWLELSKTAPDSEDEPPPSDEEQNAPPTPTDYWSLVRAPGGQTGWALTPRLIMAIPDEVAQYAEGRRIVSYFPLATVQDGDQTKHVWLWTTVDSGDHPYDFASFRVFIWNLRRHRYETAYIERNLHGFSPVLVKQVEFSPEARTKLEGKYPGFSVCVENSDGKRYRREYALLSNIVRFAGEGPCEVPPSPLTLESTANAPAGSTTVAAPPSESFVQKVERKLRSLTGKWLKG
jgi:hypothetical protein